MAYRQSALLSLLPVFILDWVGKGMTVLNSF